MGPIYLVRVRVGAWMSQCREQSQVGRFTPRPHFIVITIAQRAHYTAESETACRVNFLKLVSPNQPDSQQLWVRVRVRVRVRVGGGMGHLKTENTQVIPPPAFYCINHNQARPLQSKE